MEDDQDEMFKPPKMEDEEYSPFGGKGGLFSEAKACLMMMMRLVNNVVSYKCIQVQLEKDTCESQFIWFVSQGDLFSDAPKTEPMEKTVIQATGKT